MWAWGLARMQFSLSRARVLLWFFATSYLWEERRARIHQFQSIGAFRNVQTPNLFRQSSLGFPSQILSLNVKLNHFQHLISLKLEVYFYLAIWVLFIFAIDFFLKVDAIICQFVFGWLDFCIRAITCPCVCIYTPIPLKLDKTDLGLVACYKSVEKAKAGRSGNCASSAWLKDRGPIVNTAGRACCRQCILVKSGFVYTLKVHQTLFVSFV